MVIIKTPEQVEGIRKSCKELAKLMKELVVLVKPGVTTRQLNDFVEERIAQTGGIPAFKNYRGIPGVQPFPTALCASVNETIVHGPSVSDEPLKEGDIIGLDCGINLDGYFSDMAVTVAVGQIDSKVQNLMDITKASLDNGIKQIKPGNTVRDIAKAIEDTITPHNFGIVKDFVGHGVGLSVHEDPRIPNYVSESLRHDLDLELKEGMVFAIEPMVTLGTDQVDILGDGWSAVTADGSYAAHYEHTVLITADGYEILTQV